LLFVSNFMAWFAHEDNEAVRWVGWADLWKFALWYAADAGPQARAGPPPDIIWRWLAELAVCAAEEGDVRLPAHALACVLYWELCDYEMYDFSQIGSPRLRAPVAAPKIKAKLAAVALRCLLVLPSGEGVLYRGDGVWTASLLAMFAAQAVDELGAEHGLLTRELAALAGDTLAKHEGHVQWRSARPPHRGSRLPRPFRSPSWPGSAAIQSENVWVSSLCDSSVASGGVNMLRQRSMSIEHSCGPMATSADLVVAS